MNTKLSVIRKLRKKQNISMKELGLSIGVSESTISLYENGKRQPDYNTLIKIADYFNVSTDYLLGHTCFQSEGSNIFIAHEKQLIKKYRLLDQHGQKAVDSVLNIEYERCSNSGGNNNLVEIPYVARSETGERGTLVKTQEEVDEFLKNLNPDTSGRY